MSRRIDADHTRGRDRPLTFSRMVDDDLLVGLGLPWRPKTKQAEAANATLAEALLGHRENRWVSYSRCKNRYTGMHRYRGRTYTYTIMMNVVEELLRLGLVEEERARSGDHLRTGLQSRFRATPKLIEALADAQPHFQLRGLIRLKDEEGHLIGFSDTDETRRMRRELEEFNEFLGAIEVQLFGPDVVPMGADYLVRGRLVPIAETGLYRVFNRGSFDFGGRFYAPYQSLPKAVRRRMLINGEPVAEPDFAQLHPTLLYRENDLHLEGDAYNVDGFKRDQAKIALNVLINAPSRQATLLSLTQKPCWPYSWRMTERLVDALMQRHAGIADLLHADRGIRLMRIDSEITRQILKAAMKEGIPLLPVHDSNITPARYESRMAEIMETAAEKVLRAPKPCRVRVSAPLVSQVPPEVGSPSPLPSSPFPLRLRVGPLDGTGRAHSTIAEVGDEHPVVEKPLSSSFTLQGELFDLATLADPMIFGRRVQEIRARYGLSWADITRMVGSRRAYITRGDSGRVVMRGWSRDRIRTSTRAA